MRMSVGIHRFRAALVSGTPSWRSRPATGFRSRAQIKPVETGKRTSMPGLSTSFVSPSGQGMYTNMCL